MIAQHCDAFSKPLTPPCPVERAGLMPGGRIVITDDGRGLARGLEHELRAAGVAVERIGGPESTDRLDFASGHRRRARASCESRGPLAGIVHALPMGTVHPVSTNRKRLVGSRQRRGQGALPAGKSDGA